MGLQTRTTWTAEAWHDGSHTSAELERGAYDDEDVAVFTVNYRAAIRLSAEQLRQLAKAANLIADEIDS